MAETVKVLGQAAPAATTPTDVYTVGGGKTAIVSTVNVCNRGGTSATFRLSVAVGGGATGDKDYLYYDTVIPANDSFNATIGITLAATDVVRIYASNTSLSINLFGVERS